MKRLALPTAPQLNVKARTMTTIVREMTLDDFKESNEVLRDHFYGKEPTTQTPGQKTKITGEPNLKEYRLGYIRQGTSLVAVDQSNNNRLVGVAFAGAMQASDLEKNWEEVKEAKRTELIEHIYYFLSDLERQANVFEHFGIASALYLNVIAVDSTILRQGLGHRLIKGLIEVGRAKGFPVLVATCTSLYSQQLMAKFGGECVLSKDYVDYKDEDGNVILRPPAPHTKASVMAIRL